MYRIGIDVGGTFTDLVAVDDGGATTLAKVPSTPQDPSLGVLDGLDALAAAARPRPRRAAGADRAHRARHDGRDQRAARAQGRAGRPADDRRPSRRHRDARGAQGRPLQPAHAAARAAGAARSCGSACASACAPTAGSRSPLDRGSLDARHRGAAAAKRSRRSRSATCTPGATRATSARPREALRARAARRLCLALLGGAAADQGVRAGLDDRRQRLCRPGAGALSGAARGAAARGRAIAGRLLIIQSHGGVAPIAEAGRLAAGAVLSGPAGGVAGSRLRRAAARSTAT